MMTAPVSVERSDEVDVLYISYRKGDVSRTVAVDPKGEILADLDANGDVLGIECLSINAAVRADLDAFARRHALMLPPDVDSFAS